MQQLLDTFGGHAGSMNHLALGSTGLELLQPPRLPTGQACNRLGANTQFYEVKAHVRDSFILKRTATAPSCTCPPTVISKLSICASPGATSVCSIFIASRTAIAW